MRQFFTLIICCFLSGAPALAQYTETINSNRPGVSMGAFSVGFRVIQLETGISFGQDKHALKATKANLFGVDYELRYGLSTERLEINLSGTFLSTNKSWIIGANEISEQYSNFKANTLGLKYLIYDPYKKRSLEERNIRSWDANYELKWRDLIPAVSLYAGANILFGNNPYTYPDAPSLSPKIAIITQNNYLNWVFVMNFIADKFSTDYPRYSAIFTLTHSFKRKYSVFSEYQIIKNDLYSDNLLRAGGAYLINDDFQVDLSGLVNFKNSPSRWQVSIGLSYRIDKFHKDSYVIPKDEQKKEPKPNEDAFGVNEKTGEQNAKLIKKQSDIHAESKKNIKTPTFWQTVNPKSSKKDSTKKDEDKPIKETTWEKEDDKSKKETTWEKKDD